MKLINNYFFLSITILIISCSQSDNQKSNKHNSFSPGEIWTDNNGVHINAHGGGILFHEGKYYWYGEHKIEGKAGNRAMVGVHCYSSTDLYNWEDEGIVMPVSKDTTSLIVEGCIIERPKVIYNKNTGKFIMWFHHELKGMGYEAAKTGLAVSDNPTGKFEYIKSINPNAGQWPVNFSEKQKQMVFPDHIEEWTDELKDAIADGYLVQRDFEKGQMARDMTLFVDEDGKAYHIHASEENLTLHISELNNEYTDFTGKYVAVMPAGHNEAPAIFKKDGKYYLIASGCTGWAPNAARSFVADHILGPWKSLGNPCKGDGADLTFHSQSTYILPVKGMKNAFIFMGDRWTPNNAIDGRYIWLPIKFNEHGNPTLEWTDNWSLEYFNEAS